MIGISLDAMLSIHLKILNEGNLLDHKGAYVGNSWTVAFLTTKEFAIGSDFQPCTFLIKFPMVLDLLANQNILVLSFLKFHESFKLID